MEKGKLGEQGARAVLRKNILRDIKYLQSKGLITNNEIYYLIKNFLKNYMNLNYEFTKDELLEELKNIYLPYRIRDDFFRFVDTIFMFEYSEVSYSDKELRDFLKEFEGYMEYLLVPSKEPAVKQGFFSSLRHKLIGYVEKSNKEKKGEVAEEKEPDTFIEKEEFPVEVIDSVKAAHADINGLIEKIYDSISNKDVESASAIYREALSLYNELTPEEKVNYYETLNEAYESITKV
ncbi:MAG: hypothetical protein ABH828_05800 [archaeon]